MAQSTINIAHPQACFIDGQWVEPAAGEQINVICAHSEEVIATVAEAGEAEVEQAALAARRAFDEGPWPRLSPQERAEYVRRLSAALKPECRKWRAPGSIKSAL
jgi:acyl-CoA reductase-like NAD-dependent aldehyde dehydrogenase